MTTWKGAAEALRPIFCAALALLAAWGGWALAASDAPALWLRLRAALPAMGAAWAFMACLRRKPPASGHGSAGFAAVLEAADLLLPPDAPLPSGGVLLGTLDSTPVVLPPPYTGQHGLIVGPSGAGKSFSFFLPNVAHGTGVSCVVTDPKSELWRYTSGLRQGAVRYAPAEPDASECFNFIPLCADARTADLCARAVVEAGATERQEAPWPDLEAAFLAALFSHAATLEYPTPLSAYRLLCRTEPERLMDLFLASPSDAAREQAVIFKQTHERMRGSITPVLAAKLQWLRDPTVARFTSASLQPPDFTLLRRSPQVLYWCVREQDLNRLRGLSSVFFTLLLEQLSAREAGLPVYIYLDEFANVATLPEYAVTVSLARGRNLSLWHGVQSLSQLNARYGKDNAGTILTNCSTKVALCGLDVETAEYFSRALGEGTAVSPRRTYQKMRLAPFAPHVSDTALEHGRPLLTPDEVRRIGQDEALVISGNRRPLLLRKWRYDRPPCARHVPPLGQAKSVPLGVATATAKREAEPPPKMPEELRPVAGEKGAGKRARRKRPRANVTYLASPRP